MSTIGYFQGSQKRFSLEESTAKLIKAIDECNKSTSLLPPFNHYMILIIK